VFRLTICDFKILSQDRKQEIKVSSRNQGHFRKIPFKKALELTGLILWNSRGKLVLAETKPTALYEPVKSEPEGIEFLHNRTTRQVVFKRFNSLIGTYRSKE